MTYVVDDDTMTARRATFDELKPKSRAMVLGTKLDLDLAPDAHALRRKFERILWDIGAPPFQHPSIVEFNGLSDEDIREALICELFRFAHTGHRSDARRVERLLRCHERREWARRPIIIHGGSNGRGH